MKRLCWLSVAAALLLLCAACGGVYTPEGERTGDGELDEAVLAVLQEVCDKGNTPEENAAAVYQWIAEGITYRPGTADLPDGFTQEKTAELAAEMLEKRRGNCDGEAALLAVLLRRMGCTCVIVEGQFLRSDGSQWVDHAWVIAEINGAWYHLDPLYGRYYGGEALQSYCMADDAFLRQTHRWEADQYPACS